jgi:hypothetical protein
MHDGLVRIGPEQLGDDWITVVDHRILDGGNVRYRFEIRPDPPAQAEMRRADQSGSHWSVKSIASSSLEFPYSSFTSSQKKV